MVLMKNIACVLLVFLCAAGVSIARLNPKGAEVNEISDTKASIATSATKSTTVKSLTRTEGKLNKPNAELHERKSAMANSASSVEDKTSARISRLSDEVDGALMAFAADYHRPMHHPPKNNK